MDQPLEVELGPKQNDNHRRIFFFRRSCSDSDVVFYLQVGNIRLSLDKNRWNSQEVTQLLEDAKLLLNHPYCEDWHIQTLYDLATAFNNTELLIILIQKGFRIDPDNIIFDTPVTEDVLDALIERGETKRFLTDLVYRCHRSDLKLLKHLDNSIGIDLEYFYKMSNKIYRIAHTDSFRFILQKIVDTTENFDIHTIVTETTFRHEAVDTLRILVDEFGLDPRNYIKVMLHRLQFFADEISFYLFSFPYIEQHIGLFDMELVRSRHSYNVVKTCAYLLSLGADFHIIKENLDLAYPNDDSTDPYGMIDYFLKYSKPIDLEYAKIIKKRLLDFFEQRVVTKNNVQELYKECLEIIDEKMSIELSISEIVNLDCFYKWKDEYLNYYLSVGVHIYVANTTKIQIIERRNEDSGAFSKSIGCFRNIFRSVSDIIDSGQTTQQVKDVLLIVCFHSPVPSYDDALKYRDICTDFVQDYTNTILLLLQHGADLNKILKSSWDSYHTLDIIRGSETLVDIVLETDPGIFEQVFQSAVDNLYVNIVEHILKKYPHEITLSIIQDSRFIHSYEITVLVVNHLTSGYDVEDTENIVRELISDEILLDFINSLGDCISSDIPKKMSIYSYLLHRGLDCRAHGDIVVNKASFYGVNRMIQISLPYRLKADKKTVCRDLLSIIKSFNRCSQRNICLGGFDEIVECTLTSGAFSEEPDLLLEVLKQYQQNGSWFMVDTSRYFSENRMKYKIDALFDEYATAIIGPNYRELLKTA